MAQGIGNSAACRAVGINRRSGTRRRYGRTITNRVGQPLTYPPILTPARPVAARFLCEDERIAIGDGPIASHSIRAIAAQLGRSPSTISREIQNNCDPETGDYHPFRAQQRSTARRSRPKVGKLAEHVELREHVQRRLEQRWSPEQISRTLAVAFPDRPGRAQDATSISTLRSVRPSSTPSSAGRSLIITIGSTNRGVRCSGWRRGRRQARPVRSARVSSRRSWPRPWT
jgi:hypothetical protein